MDLNIWLSKLVAFPFQPIRVNVWQINMDKRDFNDLSDTDFEQIFYSRVRCVMFIIIESTSKPQISNARVFTKTYICMNINQYARV